MDGSTKKILVGIGAAALVGIGIYMLMTGGSAWKVDKNEN